jgi:UDP-N-acetyl-2-amino-2-deoxyglucuronate dehydrogenase
MELGVGIVGCGMIAKFHARAVADTPGLRLVAATSRQRSSADRFASEFPCRVYDSVAALCEDPDVHVVSICTASGAHLEPGLIAARAGKHVIVEKPLEVTVARCDELIEACDRAGVVLSTIFPSRFHAASRHVKAAVEAGRFGRLTMGDACVKWFRTQQYYDSGAWRGTWELDGGGALMNQAIHSVDLLLWLMGDVQQVMAHTATLAHENIEVEDVATATLQFSNGALGVIQASTAVYPGMLKRIEIHGSRGSAVIEEEDLKLWSFADPTPQDEAILQALTGKTTTGGGAADPAAIGHHGHAAQFADLLAAIRSGRAPQIDGREGRKSVELISAIYRSARSGQAVRLP